MCEDNKVYKGDIIVTTIPWQDLKLLKGVPCSIMNDVRKLKHNSIQVDYFKENIETDAHWIYYPDENISYHRILNRHSFCPESHGYWTETNAERVKENQEWSFFIKYAYPLNTLKKEKTMEVLIKYAETKKIYPLGRWGEHQHYNSDVVVQRAMDLFERIYN